MKALIVDTETNGKIKNSKWKLTPENLKYSRAITLDNFPRITQIAWQLVDLKTGKIIEEFQCLIKPDGWTIPKKEFFIENNMSTERCEEFGIDIKEVLPLLVSHLEQCDLLVSHSIDFDVPVIKCEMLRYGFSLQNKSIVTVCTMKQTTEYCKIPSNNKYSVYKYPKLTELYNFLFNKDFDGNHDAMADVNACRECFIHLIKLGIIQVG